MAFLAVLMLVALAAGCSGMPAASVPATVINVVLTNAGCAPDRAAVPAGNLEIHVVNEAGDAVTELEVMQDARVLAERENLAPGLSGTINLSLAPGSYVLYCPGASTDKTPFEVTQAP